MNDYYSPNILATASRNETKARLRPFQRSSQQFGRVEERALLGFVALIAPSQAPCPFKKEPTR